MLSRNIRINLSKHFDDFISQLVGEGRYGSVSEVVRAGLQLLEDNEIKLISLRDALREGEESGFSPYLIDSVKVELNGEKRRE